MVFSSTMMVTTPSYAGKMESAPIVLLQAIEGVRAEDKLSSEQKAPDLEVQKDDLHGEASEKCKIAIIPVPALKVGRKRVRRMKFSAANVKALAVPNTSEPQIIAKPEIVEPQLAVANIDEIEESLSGYHAAHVGVLIADEFRADGLLDSGANVSAVSYDFYRKNLHGRFHRVATPTGFHIRVGDSRVIAPRGRITLIVSVKGHGRVHHTFHILDNLPKDVILGTGYLAQTKALMDWKEGTL